MIGMATQRSFYICNPLIGLLIILHKETGCPGLSLECLANFHERTGKAISDAIDLEKPHAHMSTRANELLTNIFNRFFPPSLEQFSTQVGIDCGFRTLDDVKSTKSAIKRLLWCKHWGLSSGHAHLLYGRVLLCWGRKLQRAKCEDLNVQETWHVESRRLLENAMDAARTADDELATFDSQCLLAAALAHSCEHKGQVLPGDNATECTELYDTLYKRVMSTATCTTKVHRLSSLLIQF